MSFLYEPTIKTLKIIQILDFPNLNSHLK